MLAIETRELIRDFRSPEKDPGFLGAVRSLWWRRWKSTRAVDRLSLKVEEGELIGFLGVNGAGKTTTLKMLSGLLHPSSGEVRVLGHVPWKRETSFQKQFALVMGQRTQLWWEIAAQETFLLNRDIYGLSDSEYKRNLSELVELLELAECLAVPVKKLSLGQRMRAELAAALLHHPRLLLLDEPTLGLDVVMQKKVRNFIKEYNSRHRATIVLTSHNMGDVVALCPRVVVIERGALLYDGSLEELVLKYAGVKVIKAVFEREVGAQDLSGLGQLMEREPLRAVLEVARPEVSRVAAALLQKFPVADLAIEEIPIDEVVRRLFTHQ